jgi:hypothetical protein
MPIISGTYFFIVALKNAGLRAISTDLAKELILKKLLLSETNISENRIPCQLKKPQYIVHRLEPVSK